MIRWLKRLFCKHGVWDRAQSGNYYVCHYCGLENKYMIHVAPKRR